MRIRHSYRSNEEVITAYGTVKLDGQGMVTNLDELNLSSPEQLLTQPNFVDADVFPATNALAPTKELVKEDEAKVPSQDPDQETGDRQIYDVIVELLQAGAPTTSEGHIDMSVLNEELRKRDMQIISGTRRKEIFEKFSVAQPAFETGNEGK